MDEIEPRSSAIVTTTATSGATSFITTDLLLTAGDTAAIESGWAYVTSATAAAAALVGQQRPLARRGVARQPVHDDGAGRDRAGDPPALPGQARAGHALGERLP